jgi:hypothetical protein
MQEDSASGSADSWFPGLLRNISESLCLGGNTKTDGSPGRFGEPSEFFVNGTQSVLATAAGRLGATHIATGVAAAGVVPMEQTAEQAAMATTTAGRLWSAAANFDRRGASRLGTAHVATGVAAAGMAMAVQPAKQAVMATTTAGRLRSAAADFDRRGAGRLGATDVTTCVAATTTVLVEQAAQQAAVTRATWITTAWLGCTARRFCAAVAAAKQVERLRARCAGEQRQAGQQGQRQHNPTLHGTYS